MKYNFAELFCLLYSVITTQDLDKTSDWNTELSQHANDTNINEQPMFSRQCCGYRQQPMDATYSGTTQGVNPSDNTSQIPQKCLPLDANVDIFQLTPPNYASLQGTSIQDQKNNPLLSANQTQKPDHNLPLLTRQNLGASQSISTRFLDESGRFDEEKYRKYILEHFCHILHRNNALLISQYAPSLIDQRNRNFNISSLPESCLEITNPRISSKLDDRESIPLYSKFDIGPASSNTDKQLPGLFQKGGSGTNSINCNCGPSRPSFGRDQSKKIFNSNNQALSSQYLGLTESLVSLNIPTSGNKIIHQNLFSRYALYKRHDCQIKRLKHEAESRFNSKMNNTHSICVERIITSETRGKLLTLAKTAYSLIQKVVCIKSFVKNTMFFTYTKRKINKKIDFIESANPEHFTNEEIKKLKYLMDEIMDYIEKGMFGVNYNPRDFQKIWGFVFFDLKDVKGKYERIVLTEANQLYKIDKDDKYRYFKLIIKPENDY